MRIVIGQAWLDYYYLALYMQTKLRMLSHEVDVLIVVDNVVFVRYLQCSTPPPISTLLAPYQLPISTPL